MQYIFICIKLQAIFIILSSTNMKIDLGRDPLFEKQESPVKQLKQQERERQRQLRINRMYPTSEKRQLNVQIVDPLPEELQKYRHEIEYKKTFESSKASQKLKKYIIQQERNLKCVRLQKIDMSQDMSTSRARRSQIRVDFGNRSHSKEKQQKHKEINIPKIQQMFKNQQKEFILYESRMMRNQLSKAINLIDNGVNKLKSYSLTGPINSNPDTRKNTVTDKFNINGNASGVMGSNNSNQNQQDVQIDKIIQKKLILSKKLRDRLYKQKKQMATNQAKESAESKSLNFFINIEKKPKKKVILQGVKSITFCEGQKKFQVTPASSLLFSLNKMSNGRDRKEVELQGLIQNSYQNRESILSQKSNFYEKQTPFNDLSPSNQFRLRQLMDKKLMHRLQLSKQQINKFVAYLSEIKDYHVILNETMLQILKQVRLALLSGKVMKSSDLAEIVQSKPKNNLTGHPNELILHKLFDMMI